MNTSNWNTFAEGLKKEFAPISDAELAWADLTVLRQGGKTMQEYQSEFRALMIRLPAMDEWTRIRMFTDKSSMFMQEKLAGYEGNLEGLYAKAAALQLAEQQVNGRREHWRQQQQRQQQQRQQPAQQQRQQQRQPAQQQRAGMNALTMNSGGRLSNEERNRLYREKKCFKCQQPGHIARECPERGAPAAAEEPTEEKKTTETAHRPRRRWKDEDTCESRDEWSTRGVYFARG
jgi:hypothetical protein